MASDPKKKSKKMHFSMKNALFSPKRPTMIQKPNNIRGGNERCLFFIKVGCISRFFSELIAEGLGSEDFKFGSEFAELHDEVIGGCDMVGEDDILVVLLHFFLRVVERQRTKELGIVGVDLDADIHGFSDRTVDAVLVDEELVGFEGLWEFIGLIHLHEVFHSVEGIDARFRLLGVIFGFANEIPTLEVDAQAVRSEQERVRFGTVETLVGGVQIASFFHRADDGREESGAFGNVLEDDTVLHITGQVDHVADGKRVHEPGADSLASDVTLFGDVVLVGGFIALNGNAEDLCNRGAVATESAFTIALLCVVIVRVEPSSVDLADLDTLGRIDGVYQPNEAVKEFILCSHRCENVAVKRLFSIVSYKFIKLINTHVGISQRFFII